MTRFPRPLTAATLAICFLASSCGTDLLGADPDVPPTTAITPKVTVEASPTTTAAPPTSTPEPPESDDVISGVDSDTPTGDQALEVQPAETAGDADQLPLPATAAELAVALSEAERTVRNPGLSDDEVRRWGRRQQQLYRLLAVNEEWKEPVLASVDEDVSSFVALNWVARENLTSLVNSEELAEEMPAWEVVEPLPPQELVDLYKKAEQATGVSWEFMAAINLVETRMGRIRGISTAGAVGPMQFLPTTWAECCEGDPTVPADAIMGAAQYLVDRGGPDNMPKAVRGYNNSAFYVNAVTAYAEVMMSNERAYWGYHGWEIYFRSSAGLVEIPIGYYEPEPVDAEEWVAEHPETLFQG